MRFRSSSPRLRFWRRRTATCSVRSASSASSWPDVHPAYPENSRTSRTPAAVDSVGAVARSTTPTAPTIRHHPAGSTAACSPSRTSPITAFRATGPPTKTSAGVDARAPQTGNTSDASAPPGRLSTSRSHLRIRVCHAGYTPDRSTRHRRACRDRNVYPQS